MKIEYLIAVIFIALIAAMPLSITNVYAQDEVDERNVGEAIVVNVKDYEPKVVTAGVLEENEVPVYAFLEGYTLGKFLGIKETTVEPFYGNPKIKSVKVSEKEYNKDYVRSVIHYKPSSGYSLDNLGYTRVMLKKVEKEHEVPDSVTINLTARIEFYFERGWGIGEQDLVLPKDADEKEWLGKVLIDYAFWSEDGYIRISDIKANEAVVVVYDGSLRKIKTCRLSIGETCGPITLREVYGSQDQFRIKLQDIVDPGVKRAELEITVDGDVKIRSLVEGRNLYPGSEWKISEISRKDKLIDSQIIEEVTIKNGEGDERKITRAFGGYEDDIYSKKLKKDSIKIESVYDIEEALKSFDVTGVKVDTLSVKSRKFNEIYYFTKDDSLAEFFNVLLLKENLDHELIYDGEGREVIEIKIKEAEEKEETSKDPCDNLGVEIDTDNKEKEENYCRAIDEFKQLIDNFPDIKDENGILWKEKAYLWIGEAYYNLYRIYNKGEKRDAARRRALDVYRQTGSLSNYAQSKRNELELDVAKKVNYEVVIIEDGGRIIDLRLNKVILEDVERAVAFIEIGSTGTEKGYKEGETLFKYLDDEPGEDNIGSYKELIIKEISEDKVIVEKIYEEYKQGMRSERGFEELKLKKSIKIGGVDFRLDKTDLKRMAVVTVLPGTDETVYSESGFTLHIPIEKRLINLTPEQIERNINATEKIIKDLDNVIDKLEKLVTTWKTACLITFAAIAVKNSFFTGLSRTEARNKVMNEEVTIKEEKYMGWKDYCTKKSATGEYKNYDVCMSENSLEITKQIENTQGIIEKTNKEMKDVGTLDTEEKQGKFFDLHNIEFTNYGLEEKDVGLLYNYGFLTPEDAKELTYLKNYNQEAYEEKINEYQTQAQIYNLVEEDLAKNIDKLYKKDDTHYFIARNNLIEKYTRQVKGEQVKEETVNVLVEKVEGNKIIDAFKKNMGSVKILKVEGVYEPSNLIKQEKEECKSAHYLYDPNSGEIKCVKKYTEKYEGVDVDIVVDGGTFWYDVSEDKDNINLLYYSKNEVYECKNTNYAKTPNIQIDKEGRPSMIPVQGKDFPLADYVKVDYPNSGNKILEIWNVGPNGIMGDEDDCIQKHYSVLSSPDNKKWLDLANQAYRQAEKHKKGEKATIFGKNYIIDDSLAIVSERLRGPQCQDVMDPGDCSLLFAVCDPVLCPASRCDLGGKWPVSNVIQTGLVGSLVLCTPNFPEVPVPICLTGILAGLQNLKTVFEGYVECLKTAQVQGISVGVCDKIRSVFICELIWKELISIFDVHGGIMNWISEKIYGQREGGGEYLTFKSSMQNTADSVKFFTQEYAQSAFAAYTARSMEEVGTELCRAAIFGKAPWFEDFVAQISAPESPPQFTAVFSEMPWSETMQESRYNVYYHIYSGEDQDVTYSVFLRNKYDTSMGVYYVTENCGGRRGRIEQGGFADYSVDCVERAGFTEVCVEINGKTSCGFGKVSSAYALGYLNDLIVEGELKRNIDSEAECVPDNPTFSSGLSALVGLEEAGISPGLLRTGTVRVCSVTNPGQGTNPSDWEKIGDCGKDEKGRFLGYCWIDMSTISIKNTEKYDNAVEKIRETGLQNKIESMGIEVWNEKIVNEKLEEIKQQVKFDDKISGEIKTEPVVDTKEKYLKLIEKYQDIILHYTDVDVLAEAQFMIGMIYFKLAELGKVSEVKGSKCGDGIIQRPNSNNENEECDGGDIGDCKEGCDMESTIDSERCVCKEFCGDEIIQNPNDDNINEECDGKNLGGKTCLDFGYEEGKLSCKDCKYDPSDCSGMLT